MSADYECYQKITIDANITDVQVEHIVNLVDAGVDNCDNFGDSVEIFTEKGYSYGIDAKQLFVNICAYLKRFVQVTVDTYTYIPDEQRQCFDEDDYKQIQTKFSKHKERLLC